MERKCNCSNCCYFEFQHSEYWGIDLEKECVKTGDCHRFPPSMMGNYTKYPKVTEKDWCGEHQMKEENNNGH